MTPSTAELIKKHYYNPNYVAYHIHSMLSNPTTIDSTTPFQEYIMRAVELGMKALAFSEHGNIYEWAKKKQLCDKAGIKYIHGIEAYTYVDLMVDAFDDEGNQIFEDGEPVRKMNREAMHIGLYAKNWEGVKEINTLSSKAFNKADNSFYYKPRIQIDDIYNTSDNIIVTTACLGGVLWQKRNDADFIRKFMGWAEANNHRVFLEIQYHTDPEQVLYNKYLNALSQKFNVPLIAGTDSHNSTERRAKSRKIMQLAKNMQYGNEDAFDVTFKSYEELVDAFEKQGALPMDVVLEAIDNTNKFADMIEEFELDKSFKYPELYPDAEQIMKDMIKHKLTYKIQHGIIDVSQLDEYKKRVAEEYQAFKAQGMISFMAFMCELVTWCWANGIPVGYGRGSVAGSTLAYILDVTDVDPVKWNTVFSRFCNPDRISLADIDIDFAPKDREKVYQYIIDRFGIEHASYIITFNTVAEKGTIDEICRAYHIEDDECKYIKQRFEENEAEARAEFPKVFEYFDDIVGTVISKGKHPAGMIACPLTLMDNLGIIYDEGQPVSSCSMKVVDGLNYVKYDILGLKNVGIIKDTYKYLGVEYRRAHEIDWEDKAVWDDMITSPAGVFQFESRYAFDLLKQFQPQALNDMNLVNASMRPSGASYRDRLIARQFNVNPSPEIDDLLKDNLGYLVFQEDTIKFLTDICGMSGGDADTCRRGIGKKDKELLDSMMPDILEGYCKVSSHAREEAELEAQTFLQIIEDASDYQFGFNHSQSYSMIGYTCAYLRYYHPLEFCTAFMNNAEGDDDIANGVELARLKGITINSIKFRYSKGEYFYDQDTYSIYKGIGSIKFLNNQKGEELYALRKNKYASFTELLTDVTANTSCDSRDIKILIALNFFEEFGKNGKLLKYFNHYQNLYGAKQRNKKKLKELGYSFDLFAKYGNETKTMYNKLDSDAILKELWDGLKNEELKLKEQYATEMEYIGYPVTIKPEVSKDVVIVLELNTKYTPKFTAYHIATGESRKLKLAKGLYNQFAFPELATLTVLRTEQKSKNVMIDGRWAKSKTEFEEHLMAYEVTAVQA